MSLKALSDVYELFSIQPVSMSRASCLHSAVIFHVRRDKAESEFVQWVLSLWWIVRACVWGLSGHTNV